MDETYILVGGQWKYLYRAVDRLGQTVDFLLTARRDVAAARRFFERAINLHDLPEKITIDKSGANTAAVRGLVEDSGLHAAFVGGGADDAPHVHLELGQADALELVDGRRELPRDRLGLRLADVEAAKVGPDGRGVE